MRRAVRHRPPIRRAELGVVTETLQVARGGVKRVDGAGRVGANGRKGYDPINGVLFEFVLNLLGFEPNKQDLAEAGTGFFRPGGVRRDG